ncbi:MAG: extracellular solute-binding protein [Chloroflexota bacterium]|nr:extracellular solute-binding protein [Chloroflexota bacterium]
MSRTLALRLIAVAVLSLVVAGCGGAVTSPSPDAAESQPAASGSAGSDEGLRGDLTIWHAYSSGGAAEGAAFETVRAAIEAANPDLTLAVLDVPFDQLYTNFETEAAAGGGPDLFIAPNDNLGTEVRANLLEPVELDEAFLADHLQVAVDGSQVDGTLYAVPESLKAVAMFYNSETVGEPPATTDDLLALVEDGTRLGILQNPYHNWGLWYAFGGQIMDESGVCVADEGGVAEAFAYLQELEAAGATFYTDGAVFQDDFKLGELDIIIEGPWFTGDAKEALGDGLGVAPMPAGPAGPSQPMTGVDGWYINANSENKELALAFALEMVSPENEQTLVDDAGHIPANSTIAIADPVTEVFAEAVAEGFPRPQSEEMNNYWGNFGNELNAAIEADKDAEQAVADACAAMNEANGK